MATKHWVVDALDMLVESVLPVPHELDWKASLSTHKDWLAEHLMAMANDPNCGVLAFGISNEAVSIGFTPRRLSTSQAPWRTSGVKRSIPVDA